VATIADIRATLDDSRARLESVTKYNPYHGEHGHFASHASAAATYDEQTPAAHAHIERGEDVEDTKVRAQAKIDVVSDIADRIMSNPEDMKVVGAMHNQMHHADVPDDVRVRYAVNRTVKNWSIESADSDPDALVTQRAAAEVFGLHDSYKRAVKHIEKYDRDEVESRYEVDGPGTKVILKHMYENTQAQLEKEGVGEVVLHRGMVWNDAELPKWAKPIAGSTKAEQNPLESWSSHPSVALGFAGFNRAGGRVVSAKFPASRILSTARTGNGCLNEFEYVVLSGKGEVGIMRPTGEEMWQ
jgi:hypothetical protein